MINVNNITCKNFLSVGAVTQSVKFDQSLTLILGSNLDLGGDDAGHKNGVGKTSLLNALSYALYGSALTNIRKENLINTINGKQMLVTVEFVKDSILYRIERGRKPNVLKFYCNNLILKTADVEDDSQGDSRDTQKTIDQLLGMSHTMFKHLVALNTYTEPFLAMRAADQREVIEQLLGITLLSEKAELLKAQNKITRDQIQSDQFRIDGINAANENVNKSISSLKLKSRAWTTAKEQDLVNLKLAIAQLENVDIESEIAAHHALEVWIANDAAITELTKQQTTLTRAVTQTEKTLAKQQADELALKNHQCPMCEQHLHDQSNEELLIKVATDIVESTTYLTKVTQELTDVNSALLEIGIIGSRVLTFYDTLTASLEHKNHVANLNSNLATRTLDNNPYDEQIAELNNTAIQVISWDNVNKLAKLKDHQEFLIKLLTNKDSFIRKKIIEKNLSYLNSRLTFYTSKMGLPHQVIFQNDLSVDISQLGQPLDFDNLSRGERNRLILSLSFAFRDVWESLYQSINLLFVDELIDSGLDGAGVEAGLSMLKSMARERNKNIYLISHRDELIGRVDNILKVVKENGFTTFINSADAA